MKKTKLPHQHHADANLQGLSDTLRQTDDFAVIAGIFKQLGDTTRLRIFWLLCHTEECVINISAWMDMSSPAVSHHLRALRSAHLITCRREGKEVYYRASNSEQARLLHSVIEQVMAVACPN